MSLASCTHRQIDEHLPLWRCSHPRVHSRHDVVWQGVCASCPYSDGGSRQAEPRELGELPAATSRQLPARGLGDTIARVLKRLGFEQRRSCGCTRRKEWLNRWLPYRRSADRVGASTEQTSRGDAAELLLRFPHGFGDAVQLTTVLAHLRELRPQWTIDVACKAGAHTLFDGLCRRVTLLSDDPAPRANYSVDLTLPWGEPHETYRDSPSTKAEKCLREVFRLLPLERLCRYRIAPDAEACDRADDYLRDLCGAAAARQPVVLLHYQGNSARGGKNLDEAIARELVEVVRRHGLLPLVLDWESPPRSGLVRAGLAESPGRNHPLWNNLGTGDGAALAALVERVAFMVAIDSGPGHVAGATSTPTLVVWRRHHPVNYFGLDDGNITHVVEREHGRYIRGDRAVGEAYFRRRYRSVEADVHYRTFLPHLLDERLRQLT